MSGQGRAWKIEQWTEVRLIVMHEGKAIRIGEWDRYPLAALEGYRACLNKDEVLEVREVIKLTRGLS